MCVLILNSVKKMFFYRGKTFAYRFIEAILKEYHYYKKIMKTHFNKNLIISAEEEESFQLSNN